MVDKKSLQIDKDKKAVKDAIAAMPNEDRKIGERLDKIIMENAPTLMPRTWYGMPAYSNGNKIICYFRSRAKFGERFMTFGFNDSANLDDGQMWPIVYAITELNSFEEKKVAELIIKAVS